jgi:hypothetical protein
LSSHKVPFPKFPSKPSPLSSSLLAKEEEDSLWKKVRAANRLQTALIILCMLVFLTVSICEGFQIKAMREVQGSFALFESSVRLGVPAQLMQITTLIAGAESSARGFVITYGMNMHTHAATMLDYCLNHEAHLCVLLPVAFPCVQRH